MDRIKLIVVISIIVVTGLFLMRSQEPSTRAIDNTTQLLSGFEDKKTWGISPEKGFSIRLSKKHVSEGKRSLEVKYPKGKYPSINTKRLNQDWGEYEYFSFDVFNPQKESVDFKVRLDDVNKKRVNISYSLQSGVNKVRIDRKQIAAKIDAGHIRFVVLYIDAPKKRYTLFFDNMRLEKSGLIAGVEQVKFDPNYKDKNIQASKPRPMRKAAALAEKPVQTQGETKVVLAKLVKTSNNQLLISSGIPFARGQLKSVEDFALFDLQGKPVAIAAKVLARWPQDQSIRSVLVQLNYSIEHLYEYVILKWGVKRATKDLKMIEPNWQYAQGIIVPSAQWLCDSGVIGEQVPLGKSAVGQYDENILKKFDAVNASAKKGDIRHDGYYSTAHVYYQLYVRTGELKYYLAARRELLYYRDYEIIQDGDQRGRHIKLKEPRYVYLQAMADDYLLNGDPKTLKVAGDMAHYLKHYISPAKAFYPKDSTNFITERRIAYPFLGIISYYELTQDKEYLNIADEYMKNIYKTQLQWPDRGGFIHNLYAHDPEEGARQDEYGGSPFMTGILLEPIIKYHKLTGSDIAADSIFRLVDWMISEGLSRSGDTIKYLTSQNYDNTDGVVDLNMLTVHGFGYAYRLSGYKDVRYLQAGQKLFEKAVKSAYLNKHKHFNQNYRSSGHYLAYIRDGLANFPQQKDIMSQEAVSSMPDNIFYFADFNQTNGKFVSSSSTSIKIDSNNVYLNGASLNFKSKISVGDLSAGASFDVWPIERFNTVSFAYRIPKDVPVGVRVKTEFGDWICIAATQTATCLGAKSTKQTAFIDDGQWHETIIDAKETVRAVLPGIKTLKAFEFHTNANARGSDEFWIDDFKIRR